MTGENSFGQTITFLDWKKDFQQSKPANYENT